MDPLRSQDAAPAPDEVLVMPVELFLEDIRKYFKNTPFIALNLTRSMLYGGKEGYPGVASMLAVGFDGDHIASMPDMMGAVTGNPNLYLNTLTDEPTAEPLNELVRQTLDSGAFHGVAEEETPPVVGKIVEF